MNLLLFLSDRCNLACRYCFLSLNQGPAAVLSVEKARRAVGDHADRFGARGQVTVLGGEPLVHAELALEVCRFAAAAGLKAAVVTNATRACPKTLAALWDAGAEVVASLDGAAATHDAGRPTVSGEPSLEAALAALEGVDRARLRVNMVVSETSAGALLSNLEFLRARGFRRVSFHADVTGAWTETGLARLQASLAALPRYLRALGGALELTHRDSFSLSGGEHGYDDLVLGADGRYYPCDGLFARPYAQLGAYAVGDVAAGVDWARRDKAHAEARSAVHAALGRDEHYCCPRETWFQATARGLDAERAVRGFAAADSILGEALCAPA